MHRAVQLLLQFVNDGDERVRAVAIRGILNSGDRDAISHLIDHMYSETDGELLLSFVESAYRSGVSLPIELLRHVWRQIQFGSHNDDRVDLDGLVFALARSPNPDATELLIEMSESAPNIFVRSVVVEALAEQVDYYQREKHSVSDAESLAQKAMSAIRKAVGENGKGVTLAALESMLLHGIPLPMSVIQSLLSSGDPDEQMVALNALEIADEKWEITHELLEATTSSNWRVRKKAQSVVARRISQELQGGEEE